MKLVCFQALYLFTEKVIPPPPLKLLLLRMVLLRFCATGAYRIKEKDRYLLAD